MLAQTKKVSIYAPELEQKYDFNSGFKSLCRTIYKKVREDNDAVVALTGTEGSSKSTLGNHIGFKVDKNYTLERNCLYSPDEKQMVDAIRNLPRFAAVNADEAIKILYKQQWWRQVFINKFYRLCRQDNKISILCMPRFSEFNEGFRNHRIQLWIHVLDRGIGVAFMKDGSAFTKDPWNFDQNAKSFKRQLRGKKLFQLSLQRKIQIYSRMENFLCLVTYPDLPKDIRIKYKELAAKHKYAGLEDELATEIKGNKRAERWKSHSKKLSEELQKKGMSQTEVAKLLGLHNSTVSNW